MRKITIIFCLLLFALSCRITTSAQDTPAPADSAKASELPIHFFHLEFLVQELGSDGKPVNSRSYSSTACTGGRSRQDISIRTGSRIPVPTGSSSGSGSPTNYQYMDIGISIDVREAREVNGKFSATLVADISSLAREPDPGGATAPVVRNNRWQSPVLLPLNKATVVFTSDALDTKGSMQLVVTATQVQ